MSNSLHTCARCGIADATVLDLDTGSACHPHLKQCIAALTAQVTLLKAGIPTPSLDPAARSVLAERERQRSLEGWTEAHDDAHTNGELADAAACYASTEGFRIRPAPGLPSERERMWPWDAEWWKPTPDDRRRELVKAGALILAEIERLDRAAPARATEGITNG